MGILDRLRRKTPRQAEEVAQEVPTFEVEEAAVAKKISEIEPIFVKSIAMQSLADVRGVANELRLGNIVVIDITSLMEQDPADLKRAMDQLIGICQGIGGDVGRLTETKVLATPKFVRILFKGSSAKLRFFGLVDGSNPARGTTLMPLNYPSFFGLKTKARIGVKI